MKHEWTLSEDKGNGTQTIMEGDQKIAALNPGAAPAAEIKRQFKKIIKMHAACMAEKSTK